jgi:3-oxoacyl-[acyl-carrier-protein] synthase III
VVAHAGVLAQDLGRAHAGAAAAQDVCSGGVPALEVAVVSSDEAGNVDAGLTGCRARAV